MDYTREMTALLQAMLPLVAAWVDTAMRKLEGDTWFSTVLRSSLEGVERTRLENGEWRTVRDLDLQALLKVLRKYRKELGREKLLSPDRSSCICSMIDIRNLYVAHASSTGPDVVQCHDDLRTVEQFCRLLGFEELRNRTHALRAAVLRDFAGREGEAVRPALATGTPIIPWRDLRPPTSLQECFGTAELTPSQKNAAAALEKFLHSDGRCFVLKGYAGTGKTYFISGLVKYLASCKRNVVLAAPTGRAAHVLSTRTGHDACTIHKLIYSLKDIREYRDTDRNDSPTYKFYFALKNNEFDQAAVFIVDEASMVSDFYQEQEFLRFGTGRLLRDFIDYIGFDANDSMKKVLFIGDDAQLPPVGMSISPALSSEWLSREFRLDSQEAALVDVVRQESSSAILDNANQIRDLLRAGRFAGLEFKQNGKDAIELNRSGFLEEYFRVEKDSAGRECILVAYTNATVDEYNARIRERLHPGFESLTKGDRVVVSMNNFAFAVPLFNGQIGVVQWTSEEPEETKVFVNTGLDDHGKVRNEPITLRFRDVELSFRTAAGEDVTLNCNVLDNLLESPQQTRANLLAKARYVEFLRRHPGLKSGSPEFKQELRDDRHFNALQIRYGYALTCHKAQGGEWEHVFVDCEGRNVLNADALRWTYTAYTRAKQKLYVAGAHHVGVLKATKAVIGPTSDGPAQGTDGTPARPREAVLKMLSECLGGWQAKNIIERPYLVQLSLEQDDRRALLKVDYNSEMRITNVRVECPGDLECASEVRAAVAGLKGLSLVIGPGAASNDAAIDVTAEQHPEFVSGLKKCCAEKGIAIGNVRQFTLHHLRFEFVRDARHCKIDYFFKKAKMSTVRYVDGDRALFGELTGIHL